MTDKALLKAGNLTQEFIGAYQAAMNDKRAFCLARRNGFGASESSIILGVNKWKTITELIEQKCSSEVTQEELDIGEKDNVRKGADLEQLILQKFSDWSGLEVYKPDSQYRFVDNPQLTVNFDGILDMSEGMYIPVEAKYVSARAGNYWKPEKSLVAIFDSQPLNFHGGGDIIQYVTDLSDYYGIPNYYLTQVQQQLAALNAPFGYLAALFDKGWVMRVFKIYADRYIQDSLKHMSAEAWKEVQRKKQA